MKLWAADQEILRRANGNQRTARRLTRLEVAGAPAAEHHQSILAPLHRRAYDQAVIHLRVDREKTLAKRRLTPQERHIRGWEGWTAREVVAWWHTRTLNKTPRLSGRKRQQQQPASNGRAQKQQSLPTTWRPAQTHQQSAAQQQQQRPVRTAPGPRNPGRNFTQRTLAWTSGQHHEQAQATTGAKRTRDGEGRGAVQEPQPRPRKKKKPLKEPP